MTVSLPISSTATSSKHPFILYRNTASLYWVFSLRQPHPQIPEPIRHPIFSGLISDSRQIPQVGDGVLKDIMFKHCQKYFMLGMVLKVNRSFF